MPSTTSQALTTCVDIRFDGGAHWQVLSNEYEADFRKLLQEKNINQKKVKGDGHNSQGVVERFNKTLIGYIKRYMIRMRTKTIIDAIPEFLSL
jgi:hypothetical protein